MAHPALAEGARLSDPSAGAVTLVRPEAAPELAEESVARLAARPFPDAAWREEVVRSARRSVEARPSEALLLVRPRAGSLAIVGYTALPDRRLGFAVHIRAVDPRLTAEELAFLWAALAAGPDRVDPVLRVQLEPPASDPIPFDRALGPRGFVQRRRVDLTIEPRSAPRTVPRGPESPRLLSPSEEAELAVLIARAYDDDPAERAMFAKSADPTEDARLAAHDLLHGGVGTWVPEASFGIFEGGRLLGATLVQELHGPLISEVIVDPDARRRGLASRLLAATLAALAARAVPRVRLVATRENERAFRLYLKLGFEPNLASEGPVWVRPDLVGSLGVVPTR